MFYNGVPFTSKVRRIWDENNHGFFERWNMPHVIAAIEGQHIEIQCSKFRGTQYYSYICFQCMVLLVVYNASYCSKMFDSGQFGSNNNGGILAHSELKNAFENKKLRITEASKFE